MKTKLPTTPTLPCLLAFALLALAPSRQAQTPEGTTVRRKTTQFAFTGDHTVWAVYYAQGNYDPHDPRQNREQPPGGPLAAKPCG